MSSAKAHIIFNPVAGGGRARKIYPELMAQFKARFGDEYRLSITENKGNATKIASEISKNGTPLIICAGGDGTINEVVNGLFGKYDKLTERKIYAPESEGIKE